MTSEYYPSPSFEDGDEFYLVTYDPEGKAVCIDPVEYYDSAVHEPDSSDADAEKPCVTKARADGIQQRLAAKRARKAHRAELKRKREAVAAKDLRQLELLRLSLETILLERELLEQQQWEVIEGQIRGGTNPQEEERQRAFMRAMRQRFHDMQLPVTWDDLDTPAPTEIEEAETPINILEREDIGILFGREDVWVPNDD